MKREQVTITIRGAVQGIGYRPFVAETAERIGVSGSVRNQGGIVTVEALGTREQLDSLEDELRRTVPAGGYVVSVTEEPMTREEADEEPSRESETGGEEGEAKEAGGRASQKGFHIIESREEALDELPAFPPDLGICSDCLKEMRSAKDRRYRYGLISCTSCGPRWSILEKLPYDRGNITMKAFPMCSSCETEYKTKGGRRRHAQTISCHDCGPQMYYTPAGRQRGRASIYGEEGFERAAAVLQRGDILALKGVGGYQLLCSPFDEESVVCLRKLKGREEKPFAVLFPSVRSVMEYAEVSERERELLESAARPIVLLRRRSCEEGAEQEACKELASNVCGESRYVGAMLPSFGALQLLTDRCGPLIVTSANRSSEPIPFRDEEFALWEQSLTLKEADRIGGIYLHDRAILRPLDDSVAAVNHGHVQMIRRSRGYVPLPVFLSGEEKRITVLAVGGDLKASFAVRKGERVILSQYLGDMETYAVLCNHRMLEQDMEHVLEASPDCVVCDLHPGYHSTRLAREYAEEHHVPCLQVQHHQAHAASVMAEHGLKSCIGIVFDGTGCGTDGQLWGGEFLYLREEECLRMGNLSACRLVGGDAVSIHADLAADCYLVSLQREPVNPMVKKLLDGAGSGIQSSSVGRLFDAAASLLDVCHENRYEGECAVLLENAAWRAWGRTAVDCGSLAFRRALAESLLFFRNLTAPAADGRLLLRHEALIGGILQMRREGHSAEETALLFHLALAYAAAQITTRISSRIGEKKICLSGGSFANRLLMEVLEQLLHRAGLQVYVNEQVPFNDGGIALGQSYLAQWMLPQMCREDE